MVKLFSKSSKECRFSEKRQHPETFVVFYQRMAGAGFSLPCPVPPQAAAGW
ncbi:hypothetical protein SXCC_01266 [Gluconacetobacter sp. SXCC-1]|nr:hypothetical protein SXCC_01266 [Gluconacetobacter sp. SXCC-1]